MLAVVAVDDADAAAVVVPASFTLVTVVAASVALHAYAVTVEVPASVPPRMQSGSGPVSSVVTAVQEPHATVDVLVTVFDMISSHTPLDRLMVVVHPETTGLAALGGLLESELGTCC